MNKDWRRKYVTEQIAYDIQTDRNEYTEVSPQNSFRRIPQKYLNKK